MKKLIAIFVVAAIFTSCNDAATTSDADADSDSARAAATADSLRVIKALEDSSKKLLMDTATAKMDTTTKAAKKDPTK